MPTFRVVARRYDGTDEHVIAERPDERSAERIERGVNINLNHDEWYVTTEEVN